MDGVLGKKPEIRRTNEQALTKAAGLLEDHAHRAVRQSP
jgi:hypothetical protein